LGWGKYKPASSVTESIDDAYRTSPNSRDGKEITALAGEPIAAALAAAGIRVHRYTAERSEPRGIFCAIGQCTDCVMTVNGVPNVRTCITPVVAGMVVETQHGAGQERDP